MIQAQLARIQAHTRERAKIRFNSALHWTVGNLEISARRTQLPRYTIPIISRSLSYSFLLILTPTSANLTL